MRAFPAAVPSPRAAVAALLLAGSPLLATLPAFAGDHGVAAPPHASAGILEAPARAAPAIRTWIVHYDATLDPITTDAHAGLLRALGTDGRMLVVVPDRSYEGLFLDLHGVDTIKARQIRFVRVPGSLSIWARDRYILVARRGTPTVVLPDPAGVQVERRGDLEFARGHLAKAAGWRLMPTKLAFEGGDILCGERVALIGAPTILENRSRWDGDLDRVVSEFENTLDRRVVVVGEGFPDLPHEHVDMYVHLLDDRTVVVGDPRATLQLWSAIQESPADRLQFEQLGAPREEEQLAFVPVYDAIAAQLKDEGFRVLRVPALHLTGEDVLFSWTNAVSEQRGSKRHVYVPSYGLPLLDAAAHRAWADAGCVVHPIAARSAAFEGGAVRCLTNVVRHRPDASSRIRVGPGASTRAVSR